MLGVFVPVTRGSVSWENFLPSAMGKLRQTDEQTGRAIYSQIVNQKVLSYTFQTVLGQACLGPSPSVVTFTVKLSRDCILKHIKGHTWKADEYSIEILP